ncbi:TPR-like protein [Fragilariopsis cylindrus CCMP1102]|uniref:TPR-like protein n=1 Tax=Fragilariopsis cylindrus CCMP1102 TaxID=635003 RepID=A0A1E7EWB9_9STRA|nr:TPR-like protein [Fragilariopsis cylindrus CCMP1102]|eukprot:OEU10328.1 TPR-like protein [Fragilariopsis cylindrus CCMP1102]
MTNRVRYFGSDSRSDLSSQKNIERLKMLRNDSSMWSRRSTRDAPDRATAILQQIFQEFYDEVNARDCNQVISAWEKTKNRKDAPQQALDILEQMIDVYDKHGNDSIRPTVATYNLVINTFARKGDIKNSSMVFDMLVSDFELRQNVKAKPNLDTFGNLIYACSNSRDRNAAEISKGILARIIDWHEKGKLKKGPNVRILLTVMNACARNGDVEGATSILQMMKKSVYDVPYIRAYSILINAWSKSKKADSPAQARSILQKLINMYSSGFIEEGPNVITYTSVIDTYAAQGDVDGAMDVLEMMEADFESGNKDAKPDIKTYNNLIHAWSKSGKDDSPAQARKILQKLITNNSSGYLNEGPDVITYNSVIDAYAAQGDVDGAMDVLDMMEADFESGNKDAKPNIRTYSILIHAWSKSGKDDSPVQARRILQKVSTNNSSGYLNEGPNVITYAAVMNAYAAQGDVEGASDILKMMEADFESGNKDAKPNIRTYNTLIHAWSKSGKADSPVQARSILQKLITNNSSGYLNEGPDVITYNSVINAYAIRGDVDGATDVLEMMEADFESGNKDAKPDIRTYNSLIHAWSKSGKVHAPHEAKNILDRVIDLHSKGDLEESPDAISYNSVMGAHAAQGDVEGASDILKMMEDDFNSGNSAAKPNMRAYSNVIHAWAKSGRDDAPHEAKNQLDKIINLHSKGNIEVGPDTIAFGSVMNAYAEQGDTQGASEVNDMMKNAFKAGNKNVRPNTQTYTILIKAWGKSIKKNAPEEVEKILQEINDLHASGDLQEGPTKRTYSLIIDCLHRFKGTKKRVGELKILQKSCK